jgi:hypothetical protein
MSLKAQTHPYVTAGTVKKDGMMFKGAYGLRVYRDSCSVARARLTEA